LAKNNGIEKYTTSLNALINQERAAQFIKNKKSVDLFHMYKKFDGKLDSKIKTIKHS